MLEALMRVEGGPAIMPFVRMFYGQPSSYLWEGDDGTVHHKQGDPLMLLLFALGQHAALCVIDNSLGADDRLMAFLDDVCVVTFPEVWDRAARVVDTLQGSHPRGERPEFCDVLERVASQIQKFECGEVRECQPVNRAS